MSPVESPTNHPILDEAVAKLLNAANYLNKEELALAKAACLFGIEAHKSQTRQSGEPYITHPIAVAIILTELKVSANILIAAILHDTIEDTSVNQEDIANHFGEEVLHLVEGVTKISQLNVKDKIQAEAESLRKMLLAMSKDIGVMLIKLADRIHNMQTLGSLREEKQARIAKQTLDIFAPIAHRLGLLFWQQELEDLSFKILYPKRSKALIKTLKERATKKNDIVQKVSTKLLSHLESANVVASILERPTNIYGIYKRMSEDHVSFKDMQEAVGVVVVVEGIEHCYRTLGLIHEIYKPVAGKIKDYIAIPKINGYQSLHTTVFGPFGEPLQILIRTHDMHLIAECGVASHFQKNEHPKERQASKWLMDFLDTQEQSADAEEFLEHLKSDLFPKEVYIFTPKGDIKQLPQFATVLDFAYSVHSDIGNHCKGALVNGELAPLYQTLHNGDNVKIITQPGISPQPAWLDYIKTARARAVIRAKLRERSDKDALSLGKKLLDHTLFNQQIEALNPQHQELLLNSIKKDSWTNLLIDIGHGNILPAELIGHLQQTNIILSHDKLSSEEKQPASEFIFDGFDSSHVDFALCCHPIPGDEIIGYMRQGKGLKVHLQNCKHIQNTNNNQVLSVKWPEDFNRSLPVAINVITQNRPGVLASLAATIAAHGGNISRVDVKQKDGNLSNMLLDIDVSDRHQLAQIMRSVKNQDGINKVIRI